MKNIDINIVANLYSCKLGYIGTAYNNLNSESVSLKNSKSIELLHPLVPKCVSDIQIVR